MNKYLLLTLPVILFIVSCNKKPTPTTSKEDILRSGHWSVASGTISVKLPNGKDTALNYMNFIPHCHLDDYLIFHHGIDAAAFSGSVKCSPGDPDSTTFSWKFTDNFNALSLYNGFNFIYSVNESILPYRFDTIQQLPYLVLDTLHGVLDTNAGYTRVVVILDTIWELKFDTVAVANNNIYNGQITNFTDNSFTISFWTLGSYPDSTDHHTGQFTDGAGGFYDNNPIIRPDTFKYSVTYHKN